MFRRPPRSTLFPSTTLSRSRRHTLTVILQARVPDSLSAPLKTVLAGLEGAAIVRYGSGLPFSRTHATGDTLLGLPNGDRLPPQATGDVLLRGPLRLFGRSGGIYPHGRNLLDRRNLRAGPPGPG